MAEWEGRLSRRKVHAKVLLTQGRCFGRLKYGIESHKCCVGYFVEVLMWKSGVEELCGNAVWRRRIESPYTIELEVSMKKWEKSDRKEHSRRGRGKNIQGRDTKTQAELSQIFPSYLTRFFSPRADTALNTALNRIYVFNSSHWNSVLLSILKFSFHEVAKVIARFPFIWKLQTLLTLLIFNKSHAPHILFHVDISYSYDGSRQPLIPHGPQALPCRPRYIAVYSFDYSRRVQKGSKSCKGDDSHGSFEEQA